MVVVRPLIRVLHGEVRHHEGDGVLAKKHRFHAQPHFRTGSICSPAMLQNLLYRVVEHHSFFGSFYFVGICIQHMVDDHDSWRDARLGSWNLRHVVLRVHAYSLREVPRHCDVTRLHCLRGIGNRQPVCAGLPRGTLRPRWGSARLRRSAAKLYRHCYASEEPSRT